ncbi:protein of unknown function [Candidatus Filomicrobium marinum]|nr:protein of unknown function [Candidatus Filomicrobium marinum]
MLNHAAIGNDSFSRINLSGRAALPFSDCTIFQIARLGRCLKAVITDFPMACGWFVLTSEKCH